MREISPDLADAIAGGDPCPELAREQNDETEAAVALQKYPGGYVLGACDQAHEPKLWFTTELEAAKARFEELVKAIRETGSPFGI